MTILSMTATITGIAMALSNIPQSVKIFKRKSAKDVSILTFSTIIAGALIWTIYGIEINNFPIIISNSIGFFATSGVIIGWLKYK